MLKNVASGERSVTVVLDGTECEVRFSSGYNVVSVRAEGDTLIALDSGKASGDDGTVMCKAGGTVMYPHMRNKSSVFLTGSGTAEIIVSNEAVNPFKSAPVNGGGGAKIKYVSDGLIGYSDLSDTLVYNPVFDETLGRDVNYCDGSTYGYLKNESTICSHLSSAFSLQVLVKTTQTSEGHIFGVIYDSLYCTAVIKVKGGYFALERASGQITTDVIINYNEWHMLTAVYDGTSMKLYCDGEMVYEYEHTWNIPSNAVICVGQWQTGSSKFNGYISNACIYDRALSAEEVAYNFSVDNI